MRSQPATLESSAPNRIPGSVVPDLDQTVSGISPTDWFKIFDSSIGDVVTDAERILSP